MGIHMPYSRKDMGGQLVLLTLSIDWRRKEIPNYRTVSQFELRDARPLKKGMVWQNSKNTSSDPHRHKHVVISYESYLPATVLTYLLTFFLAHGLTRKSGQDTSDII